MSHLDAATKELLAAQKAREQALAARLSKSRGGLEDYRRYLRIVEIDGADDQRLHDFYALYARVFTLEEEREPLEGLQTVLRLNDDAELQSSFGPFREVIVLILEQGRPEPIGATNLILFAYPDTLDGYQGSAHLNFICVDEERRGAAVAGLLLADLDARAIGFARRHSTNDQSGVFITIEQNDPKRMTAKELRQDARAALIDPYDRLEWWRRCGYRKLDFVYRQPPLSPKHRACEYLDLYIRNLKMNRRGPTALPSDVLREHLRRYFFVSVGKFEIDMSGNAQWLQQERELRKLQSISIEL
jgi:hypothetical protein